LGFVSDVFHLALIARLANLKFMGLISGRNLRMAKELLEKNRHKVGDMVGKATEQVDKASGGKTANMSKKAEEAARKYSAGSSATPDGAHPDAASEMSKEETEARRAETQAKAARAAAGLVSSASGLLSRVQTRLDEAGGKMPPPDPAAVVSDSPPVPGSPSPGV
jgi:hypothetical protein